MDFAAISRLSDEGEQLQALYRLFNEDARLTHSRAAQIEFLTTARVVGEHLPPHADILDIGAGTGAYSFHLARQGHTVTAIEPAEANLAVFAEKLAAEPQLPLTLTPGNALDLSAYPDAAFDAVLLFGPLYHLHNRADRLRALAEARRVCRPGGFIHAAFISNDFVILTELDYDQSYLTTGDYDRDSFALRDFPFVFHTADAARTLLSDAGLTTLRQIAADGPAELIADRINALDDAAYAQYLRYHAYICEKPEFFGMSNHWLFVCQP